MPKGDSDKGGRPARGEQEAQEHLRTEPAPPLDRLQPERLSSFLELALEPETLLRLCRKLGLSAPGYRLEKLSTPDHAALVAEEYLNESRVRPEVEGAVSTSLKSPALRTTWVTPISAREITQLVAGDPIVSLARLAWRFVGDGDPSVRGSAERAIDAGLALLDDLDDAAEASFDKPAPAAAPAGPSPEDLAEREEWQKRASRAERDREATRAQLQQARAEIADRDKRLNELKGALNALKLENAQQGAELSRVLASRTSEERKGAQDVRRVASERAHFEKQIGELEEKVEADKRRTRELERALQEKEKPALNQPPLPEESDVSALDFTVPHFTREFYDSLEGWDRRVVKTAFEKALHLARDHRHPSLRALPLEGIENYWRVRIASDVRLIYRRGSDGRLDILSLIDREDLDRYVRQAKTRRES